MRKVYEVTRKHSSDKNSQLVFTTSNKAEAIKFAKNEIKQLKRTFPIHKALETSGNFFGIAPLDMRGNVEITIYYEISVA